MQFEDAAVDYTFEDGFTIFLTADSGDMGRDIVVKAKLDVFSDFKLGDFVYRPIKGKPGQVVLVQYEGWDEATAVPASANGNAVVAIAEGAFSCTGVQKVSIPKEIREIEEHAFDLGVEITATPYSPAWYQTKKAGLEVVDNAETLTTMVLPKALKSLDVSALSNVAAERIVLPAGVSIGANAFGNCPNLLTIEFIGDAGDVVPEAFGSASAAVITIVGGNLDPKDLLAPCVIIPKQEP